MKQLLMVVMFFPLVAFCVAGVLELRSQRSAAQKLTRLIPIVLGVAAFLLSFNPQGIFHVTPEGSITLSRIMTMFSSIIACSGAFIVYSRRSSSVWMACGGLVLAFSWMFNRVVV
jgi:hypothetical protein